MAATNVLPPLAASRSLTASPQHQSRNGDATRRTPGGARRGPKRSESPFIHKGIFSFPTNVDPSSYHNTALHNLCTDLLEKGFHLSFVEIFTLVEKQRLQHEQAGPAAILLGPLIEYESSTLDELKSQLTRAEMAKRSGNLEAVYTCQRSLAQRFADSKNAWLSAHFYERCLETALGVKGDSRKKEGEAHCFLGESWEKRDELEKACHHFEVFHQLAKKYKWHSEEGDSLHAVACEHLRRIYTSIAERMYAEDRTEQAISYLKKAREAAKEGGDSHEEGLACYRLGNALQSIGDYDGAIEYHRSYMERCRFYGDLSGVGSAYQSLSRAHESKGDIENAIKFLELFVEIAENAVSQTHLDIEEADKSGPQGPDEMASKQGQLARACSAIGAMCTSVGDFDKAVQYFERCYELSVQMGDPEAITSCRVQYGIAKGNQMLASFSTQIVDQSYKSLEALVAWKGSRVVKEQREPFMGNNARTGQAQESASVPVSDLHC
eukprot:Em0022g871a